MDGFGRSGRETERVNKGIEKSNNKAGIKIRGSEKRVKGTLNVMSSLFLLHNANYVRLFESFYINFSEKKKYCTKKLQIKIQICTLMTKSTTAL